MIRFYHLQIALLKTQSFKIIDNIHLKIIPCFLNDWIVNRIIKHKIMVLKIEKHKI